MRLHPANARALYGLVGYYGGAASLSGRDLNMPAAAPCGMKWRTVEIVVGSAATTLTTAKDTASTARASEAAAWIGGTRLGMQGAHEART